MSIFGSRNFKPIKSVDKTVAKKAANAHVATYPVPVNPAVLSPVGSALLLYLDTAHYSERT